MTTVRYDNGTVLCYNKGKACEGMFRFPVGKKATPYELYQAAGAKELPHLARLLVMAGDRHSSKRRTDRPCPSQEAVRTEFPPLELRPFNPEGVTPFMTQTDHPFLFDKIFRPSPSRRVSEQVSPENPAQFDISAR
jgi:hypothetical protein